MINLLIHQYMGFGMDHYRRSGFDLLYEALQDRFAGPGVSVRRPGKWNWHAAEDAVFDVRHLRHDARVIGIGYSYGGYNIVEYAREMQKHGVRIDHLFLLDAVWRGNLARYSWLARSASLITRWCDKKLVVPDNVDAVTSWRQENNQPMGHRIKLEDPAKTFHQDILLSGHVKHNDVEDQMYIHGAIIAGITRIVEDHA